MHKRHQINLFERGAVMTLKCHLFFLFIRTGAREFRKKVAFKWTISKCRGDVSCNVSQCLRLESLVLTSKGSRDVPSTLEGGVAPVRWTMVGMMSIVTTGSWFTLLALIPGPRIISGTRISNSYSWRLSFGNENCPEKVVRGVKCKGYFRLFWLLSDHTSALWLEICKTRVAAHCSYIINNQI